MAYFCLVAWFISLYNTGKERENYSGDYSLSETKEKAPKLQESKPEKSRDDVNVAKQNVKDCVFF